MFCGLVFRCAPACYLPGMASPARTEPPAKPASEAQPTHRLPPEAFPPDIAAQLAKGEIDPVDAKAAVAWLNGEGPNPWRESSG